MFLLDQPYVSDFLKQSIVASKAPVLNNETARVALLDSGANFCSAKEFIRLVRECDSPRLYSNSENAIDWIAGNLGFTVLPGQIDLFKDKLQFRELLRDMYPDYWFQGVSLADLDCIDLSSLAFPLIIKPVVGFFSLGVRMLATAEEWPSAVAAIKSQVEFIRRMYPRQVLDLDRFILEERIDGEEFAIDVYFDNEGNPVILNILGHLFASEKDVSDRVYITSGRIIQRWLKPFTKYLSEIGRRAGVRNFPMHVELRVDDSGGIAPIEVNPMRFAGWCCTDIAHFAYGINPFHYYLQNRRPDWDAILKGREGKVWAIVVADLPAHLDRKTIRSVDYQAFKAHFSKPLEIRPIDYRTYSVFAFLFAEVQEDNLSELTGILQSDLTEYLLF